MKCPICGKPVAQPETGRPRTYCSDRCKGKQKRREARRRDREAFFLASAPEERPLPPGASPVLAQSSPAACHVCGARVATIGVPVPLLCGPCSGGR